MKIKEGTERLAKSLLLPINPAAVIILGLYTILWGLWLLSPFWTVFTQAALYSELARVSPEWAWGALAVSCGAVTTYGAIKRRYGPLVRGAVVCALHWALIGFLYLAGDPANTGGITALTFMFYAAFVYLNIRVNFKNDRKSDDILNPHP